VAPLVRDVRKLPGAALRHGGFQRSDLRVGVAKLCVFGVGRGALPQVPKGGTVALRAINEFVRPRQPGSTTSDVLGVSRPEDVGVRLQLGKPSHVGQPDDLLVGILGVVAFLDHVEVESQGPKIIHEKTATSAAVVAMLNAGRFLICFQARVSQPGGLARIISPLRSRLRSSAKSSML